MSNRLAFATAALVLVVLGGGLGTVLLRANQPATGPVGVATASPSPSAPAPSSVPTTGPVTAPTASTSAPPSTPQCLTSDLGITIGHAGGAAGSIYVPFNATNHSARACSLTGYFGLALLDAAGKQVGGNPSRDPNPNPTPQVGPLTLNPGATATFTFHWSDVQNSTQPCPQAAQVELTAPNQVDHQFIPARTADGMTIAPCSPGGIGLTPVQPA